MSSREVVTVNVVITALVSWATEEQREGCPAAKGADIVAFAVCPRQCGYRGGLLLLDSHRP